MIKQTRGALNFLIASYKAILKHAVVVAAVASAAVVSAANAKTYDLSDDSYFPGYLPVIVDDNDGSDTTITRTKDPNYDSQRYVYTLDVNKGNMTFTNGGKLYVGERLKLSGGNLDARDTDIVSATVYLNKVKGAPSDPDSTAYFGDLRILQMGGSQNVSIKADNIYLDRQSLSTFEKIDTKNLFVGLTGTDSGYSSSSTTYTSTHSYVLNLKADLACYSSQFGLADVRGIIYHFDNDTVNNLSVGPNAYVVIGIDPTSQAGLNYVDDAYDRLGWLSADPVTEGQGYKSILYIYNPSGIKIKDGGGITVDGNVAAPKVEANTVTIGDYSVIVLSKELSVVNN